MAGKIPNEFILDLLQRVDIVDFIDARVPLKKSGNNFTARCPFHNEKSPSFSVSRDKQFYHCFGCGAHGNALTFLMEYDRLGFPEAVESLADHVGLSVPMDGWEHATNVTNTSLSPLYDVQLEVTKFYARQFKAHPEGAGAVDYLKSRGVSGELAREFMLGFAPSGWRNIPEAFSADVLERCGLIVRKERTYYDRFRNRIMFPIRDRRGRVVGFGGRVMGDESPKYLNSPETELFKKHKELYGLFEVLETTRKPTKILVVEGYMDVISLAGNGIRYSVATLGTATSSDHVALLFRYTNEVVFCFDGDKAGRTAAWKALGVSFPSLREGKQAKFLILPENEDPDTLIKTIGSAQFEERIADSAPSSEFFFQELTKDRDLRSIEERASLASRAEPILELIPKGTFRTMMFERLDELLGSRVARLKSTRLDRPPLTQGKPKAKPSTLRTVAGLLIRHPRLHRLLDADCRARLLKTHRLGLIMSQLFPVLDQYPDITSGALVEYFRGTEIEPHILSLVTMDLVVPEGGVDQEFVGALNQLRVSDRNRRISRLLEIAADGKLGSDERAELTKLLQQKSPTNSAKPH